MSPATDRRRSPAGARLDLLSPGEVARLGGLEVTTRGIVDGFLAGLHRSPRRGFSVEFAEHRQYQPGDEPRYVDWKLLARTDRLYVKQFEEETNLRAMLVLDASASMGWRGAEERLTKLDYASRLAAALAMVLLRQRDATGLVTFDAEVRSVLPPRVRRGHWQALAGALAGLAPGTTTAAESALHQVVGALRRRGMVIFCSDLLLEPALTLKALKFLRHRGHDVLVLHVADPAELELARGEETRFRDPETGRTVTLAPTDWAQAYRETVDRVVREWGAACRGAGIHYALVTTDLPFGTALGRTLAAR
ncbi:MAG: DUF58 domain-containing protein [Gemmatimonadetes bacterium]|nr:DUF58 domain-containing protein [Gemmatimonadota bacterium]MCB9519039.1 DUF58 domain-containing protein [Gemmatimonadales bacterium]HPF61166.1 DUF58 domain-containing protein [Gemmatimonadales bacterium]HRX19638.1 DUF58 domain-containing protein [Gemmatimonadales bacterium]